MYKAITKKEYKDAIMQTLDINCKTKSVSDLYRTAKSFAEQQYKFYKGTNLLFKHSYVDLVVETQFHIILLSEYSEYRLLKHIDKTSYVSNMIKAVVAGWNHEILDISDISIFCAANGTYCIGGQAHDIKRYFKNRGIAIFDEDINLLKRYI